MNKPLHETGPTPLFLAILHQRWDLVHILLKHHADPCKPCSTVVDGGWTPDRDGKSAKSIYPLQKAVEMENMEIIMRLLNAGAHPNQYSKGIQGLLTIAAKRGEKDLVRWLQHKIQRESGLWHVDWSEALLAALHGKDQYMVHLLISFGADPSKEYDGVLPLTIAANNQGFAMCV